jgi:hypothetical protein
VRAILSGDTSTADPATDTTSRPAPGRRRAVALGAAKWAVTLVIASLAIPAITTQWSDRQKELTLKDGLVSRLTQSAATAIEDAGFLVRDEAISKKVRGSEWRSRFTAIARAWNIDAAALESELAAYFPDTKVASRSFRSAFHEYSNRVQGYIFLSSQVCQGDRRVPADSLRKYLQPTRAATAYPNLTEPSIGDCWRRTGAFKDDYVAAGAALLAHRDPLLTTLVHAHAAGYSVGFRAFLKQLLPFY